MLKLHIISFDIPYPPDYGGAMDVYCKLKALDNLGVKTTLHCFKYGRKPAPQLTNFCENLHYYPRLTGIKGLQPLQPYIISSRRSEKLLQNLCKDDAPILFEGLHCCHYLSHPSLQNRLKAVRMHNIEWQYYAHLQRHEMALFKRIYFHLESKLLRRFEKTLDHANLILGISPDECAYLNQKWTNRVAYLPAFHANEGLSARKGKGDYALYQGNLSVAENFKTAVFLMLVFEKLPFDLKIAGKNPPLALQQRASKLPNVHLIANPDDGEMRQLINNAHINVLPAFQPTGVKLKLINALFQGRFCLINSGMTSGLPLDEICHFAHNGREFQTQIAHLFSQTFDQTHLNKRKIWLNQHFDNAANAKILLNALAANSC